MCSQIWISAIWPPGSRGSLNIKSGYSTMNTVGVFSSVGAAAQSDFDLLFVDML